MFASLKKQSSILCVSADMRIASAWQNVRVFIALATKHGLCVLRFSIYCVKICVFWLIRSIWSGLCPSLRRLRLQIGGLQAVQGAASGMEVNVDSQVPDISLTVHEAADQFSHFKTLPLKPIVQHIAQSSPRRPKK